MTMTALQAAGLVGVSPDTINKWVTRGKLRPVGTRHTGSRPLFLYEEADVIAAANRPTGRPRKPVEVVVEVVPPCATPGLAELERSGLFRPAEDEEPVGGGALIGYVRIGGCWLRVCRAANGVVYHEQTEWMDDDPDWIDNPEYDYLEVLRAA